MLRGERAGQPVVVLLAQRGRDPHRGDHAVAAVRGDPLVERERRGQGPVAAGHRLAEQRRGGGCPPCRRAGSTAAAACPRRARTASPSASRRPGSPSAIRLNRNRLSSTSSSRPSSSARATWAVTDACSSASQKSRVRDQRCATPASATARDSSATLPSKIECSSRDFASRGHRRLGQRPAQRVRRVERDGQREQVVAQLVGVGVTEGVGGLRQHLAQRPLRATLHVSSPRPSTSRWRGTRPRAR